MYMYSMYLQRIRHPGVSKLCGVTAAVCEFQYICVDSLAVQPPMASVAFIGKKKEFNNSVSVHILVGLVFDAMPHPTSDYPHSSLIAVEAQEVFRGAPTYGSVIALLVSNAGSQWWLSSRHLGRHHRSRQRRRRRWPQPLFVLSVFTDAVVDTPVGLVRLCTFSIFLCYSDFCPSL